MKTRVILLLYAILIVPVIIHAQTNYCATDEWTKALLESPQFEKVQGQLQQPAIWPGAVNRNLRTAAVPDTIAVVVHVLWSTATQNIPDSIIHQQIAILNEDFPRLNADTINTPAAFAAIAGRSNFVFHLARRDNFGAMTDGIIRIQTSHGPFSSFLDLTQTSAGGHNSWGSAYLNIYCCDIDPSTGAAGIAFAGSNLCMIDYQHFGRTSPVDAGRVGTHEVGHCFSLKHIWGSEPASGPFDCNNDDDVADTPPQYSPGVICGIYPLLDTCTSSGDGIMYMNYMDYTFGSCRNLFSQGQMTKMNNHLANNLPNLLNSSGLIPVPSFDAGCVSVLEPSGVACATINPVVVLRNWGSQLLTSAQIYYQIDNLPPDSVSWTGNLVNFETDTVHLPAIAAPSGAHTFLAYTGLPNGNADAEALNDTSSSPFISGTSLTVPFAEGFENAFPPAAWSFTGPDTLFGFNLDTTVSFAGSNSIVFYGRINSVYSGSYVAGLQTSFAGVSNPVLEFEYAHTYADCCGSLDTLDVLVSSDCGATYILVDRLFDSDIQTAPTVTVNSSLFIPTPSQWKHRTIDLSAFASFQDVSIRFRLVNMWGLQFYLDNVNITGSGVGLEELKSNKFKMYPNPTTGKIIISGWDGKFNLDIMQPNGSVVYSDEFMENAEIDLDVASGLYFIRISDSKSSIVKRISIE